MSEIVSKMVVPALHAMEIRYLVDPSGGTIVVPLETTRGGRYLVNLHGNDELNEVIIDVFISDVPRSHLTATALLLAELNAYFKFVTFSLSDGSVHLDTCVALSHVSDPNAVLSMAYERLTFALDESDGRIERAARKRQRRPRVLREAEEVVRRMDDAGPETDREC